MLLGRPTGFHAQTVLVDAALIRIGRFDLSPGDADEERVGDVGRRELGGAAVEELELDARPEVVRESHRVEAHVDQKLTPDTPVVEGESTTTMT